MAARALCVTSRAVDCCPLRQVFDTGPGLAMDSTSLFMAYSQDPHGTARKTRSRFRRGTGLGLPISAQLVKLMGGDIGLENRTDGERGARFWFWIPLPLNACSVPTSIPESPDSGSASEHKNAHARSPK